MHDTIHERPRVAIYARYSSNLQKPTSIADQVRLCQERADSIGAEVVRVHPDYEASAQTGRFQPALDALLLDAKRGYIDIVFAESLDRISRDQEHLHGIHKRLRYWNVGLYTLDQGEIQSIHISIGGYMNAAFIENLKQKTRRGQIGAVKDGRIPAGHSYGYRIANRIDEHGRPVRGLRKIDPDEASVIQRIYRDYAEGTSVREITAALNREGVPGPRGRPWGPTTINGHRSRRNGILNNELYHGVLIHGRQEFVYDPFTGKRQARPVPKDRWTVQDVPHLRIVDEELWQRVQKRRQAGHDRRRSPASYTPLPLTGIVRCGVCAGTMSIVMPRRYGCLAHVKKGTCSNPRGIDATRLENDTCSLLADELSRDKDPSSLIRRAAAEARHRYAKLSQAIEERNKKIKRLLAGIESGARSIAAHKRIVELEQETAAIEIERDSLPKIPKRNAHGLARVLHERLELLSGVISANPPGSDKRRHALLEVSRLVDRILIHPLPVRGRVKIDLQPHLPALVAFALDTSWSVDKLNGAPDGTLNAASHP